MGPNTSTCCASTASGVTNSSLKIGFIPTRFHMAMARLQMSAENESGDSGANCASGGRAANGDRQSSQRRTSNAGANASPKSARSRCVSIREISFASSPRWSGRTALFGILGGSGSPSTRAMATVSSCPYLSHSCSMERLFKLEGSLSIALPRWISRKNEGIRSSVQMASD